MVKGKAPIIIALLKASIGSDPPLVLPAISNVPITQVRITPQTMRCLIPVFCSPPDIMVFITRIPESAEVTKKVRISTAHMTVIALKNPPDSIWLSVTNSLDVLDAPIIAPFAPPVSSRSIAVAPNMVIQAKQTNAGAITQPRINSLTVRPLEMRAKNNPTKGENAIHHAQ